MSEFIPNQVAIEELLHDPVGPVGQLMEAIGVEGEEIARRFAPVSFLPQDIPYLLKDSMTHRLEMYRGTPGVVIGSPLRYALYPEFGTFKMSARPYLRPMLMALSVSGIGLTTALENSLSAIGVAAPPRA